jgi:RHH-type proline utilization regulon transcriptional repressor/proline dehydrogenase/delta 1-pyrroline-5-carboxylate dehydrogenase
MNDPLLENLRHAIHAAYRVDETQCVQQLLQSFALSPDAFTRIENSTIQLVKGVREIRAQQGGLDAFIMEYDLSSEEGVALMCLAEALLRIPDKTTIDKLIRDKIASADWEEHKGHSGSLFVNAMTWGLMLTGKIISPQKTSSTNFWFILKKLIARTGMPAIRLAVNQMMKIMGGQFVMAESIEDAIGRAQETEAMGYRYSYDMLGEAARTTEDAERYFAAYQHAIGVLGRAATDPDHLKNPGISVKLSALHPRYEFTQHERVRAELTPKLLALAQAAKSANIHLAVDAEEAERLDLSLDLIATVFGDPSLSGWEGFGVAVQSYQKRAMPLIDWLGALARKHQKRLMVRLVKGAYWDTEIKRAQALGLDSYPVFTRKSNTDVSFLACAKKMSGMLDAFFPQFATHNAYSVGAILEMMGNNHQFEFQCLHGMGRPLYDQIVGEKNRNIPCRVYAPVGHHQELLAYLVRRLLENGANTSFVNRIAHDTLPLQELVASPIHVVSKLTSIPHPKIPLPPALYGDRKNARSMDLSDPIALQSLNKKLTVAMQTPWQAAPTYRATTPATIKQIVDPSDTRRVVGTVIEAQPEDIEAAFLRACAANFNWNNAGVETRAGCLEKLADLLEANQETMMAIAIREAGKTIADALSEVREAIDFCRYYAQESRKHFAEPLVLQGVTGEFNSIKLQGRGVMICISPWNFPLALFLGQVSAALVAGNTVLAKPAEQTPLMAAAAVKLFHEAGVPEEVLQLLPGGGEIVGARLVADERVAGVLFTGSTTTARAINLTLAQRLGPIVPLIAETGGQNALIADSSALPEQLVRDVILSAFNSAGQRCSALRVLYLQEEIADKVITMLCGAMAELKIGDPALIATDLGPVIDDEAKAMLETHVIEMKKKAKLLYQMTLPNDLPPGHFFAPCAFEIQSIKQLTHEVFGPVLHVIRYAAKKLNDVIQEINQTGYGLTFGIHSRVNETVDHIHKQIHAGNSYVNRNIIGAVVGVQPFGGEGLSGTGPKAGGPHYLFRLCTERTLTIDTTAAGGNASLLALAET